MIKQFSFRAEYHEVLRPLSKKDRAAVMLAMCAYVFDGEEPELAGTPAAIFTLIRPQLDSSIVNSLNRLGKTKQERNDNETITKQERSDNGVFSPLPSSPPNPPINPPKEKPPKGGKKKGFTPPTLEDVEAYAKQRGSHIDPKRFWEYFDAGGWVDSKGNPVQSWKQKFITWETHNSFPLETNRGEAPREKEEVPPAAHRFVRTGDFEGYWVDGSGERID